MTELILAVDGGGSKIDAALLTSRGQLLGAARFDVNDQDAPPGSEAHMAQVRAAMEAAAADADLGKRNGANIDLGVFCLAGADLASDDRAIARWLRRARLVSEALIRNDTFAVLRAGTDRSWGVGVVCGYGTNCSGVSPDGRITRFPAIGPVSGDWGGGIDLGGSALWHAIRDEDGRGERTVLRGSIPPFFGLRRPRQVMEGLYRGTLDEQRLAELTPLIFRAAREGDAIANDLVGRQADEIVAMATVAIRRLRMQRLDVDVVLGGGVFRNDWRPFFERIRTGIQEVAPDARLMTLTAPPVVGAAMIGLDQLGAAASTHTKLRSALTHARLRQHTPRRKER